jgi:Uma2 family endonuclease
LATTLKKTAPENLAQLLDALGNIPARRVLTQPPPGTAREKDLVACLESADKRLVELVDGVLVEKAVGWQESLIASLLVHYLWEYLESNDLGVPLTADGPVRLKPGRIRIPDACFVSWGRIPSGQEAAGAILDAVPDLAAEVVSKGNTRAEMKRKLEEYFAAGVRLVWFIYPKTQTAVAYSSPTSKQDIGAEGKLDGGDVLPGFALPLAKLFSRTRRLSNGRA